METPMETEEAVSEHANNGSTKEPENLISDVKEDNMMDLHQEVNSDIPKSPSAIPNHNGDSIILPSVVECAEPGPSGRNLTSPLTFELSDAVINEQCLSDADHQILSPKDVKYTEKNNVQNAEEMESVPESEACGHSNETNRIICFVNQDAKVTPSPIIQYVLDVDQHFDTVISCADGKIGAHRLVLASASPFIGDMFCSHDHRLGEVAVLVLPDVRVAIMKVLLNFCYTGSMFFPKDDETEVLETMRLLLLGEYGDLSLKEVTVKIQPPANLPVENSENQQQQSEQEQNHPINADIQEEPGTSSSLLNSGSNEDLLMTSSSEDEEDDNDDSKSEDAYENTVQLLPGHDEEQERLAFANNFLRQKKETEPTEETTVNYLIGPKLPGCKTKKLHCYHCPGAFKSVETLTAHLDNNHGIFLQSNNLKKSELETLTNCSYCTTPHKQVSSANMCISKRSRTRCFICFEIIRIKDFEHHIKSSHSLEQRNGMWIVKCRWCEAGFMLQDPIDNKSMSAHCFSNHLPGLKNGNVSIDLDEENEAKNMIEVKVDPSPTVKKPDEQKRTPPKLASIFTGIPSSGNNKNSKPKIEPSTLVTTPKGSTSKITGTNGVPAVLALLQKASQKRKLVHEAECDNPKKKPRLDENGKRIQVAKRTGKPVGRQVHIDKLKQGVPSLTSDKKGKSKTKSVLIDLTTLPEIFVNFQYSKSFVLERLPSKESSCVVDDDDKKCDSNLSTQSTENLNTTDTGPLTLLEVAMHHIEKRLSDSRCSMPCPI